MVSVGTGYAHIQVQDTHLEQLVHICRRYQSTQQDIRGTALFDQMRLRDLARGLNK